jgi:hypothetical protein
MDQDSSFKDGDFYKFKSWLEFNDTNNVGILSPLHSPAELKLKKILTFNNFDIRQFIKHKNL